MAEAPAADHNVVGSALKGLRCFVVSGREKNHAAAGFARCVNRGLDSGGVVGRVVAYCSKGFDAVAIRGTTGGQAAFGRFGAVRSEGAAQQFSSQPNARTFEKGPAIYSVGRLCVYGCTR